MRLINPFVKVYHFLQCEWYIKCQRKIPSFDFPEIAGPRAEILWDTNNSTRSKYGEESLSTSTESIQFCLLTTFEPDQQRTFGYGSLSEIAYT